MSPQAGMMLVNEIAPRLRASARKLRKVGADCLADVSRPPEWAIDVAAQREKEACRFTA